MLSGKKKETDFLLLLIQAAENTLAAAKIFRDAMAGTMPLAPCFEQLKELETKGDQLTRTIFKGLSKVFLTPIDREDIMELAMSMDDVMDGIEATIARFDYLNVSETDKFMKEFAEVIVSSCEHILEAFKLLAKKKYTEMTEHAVRINSLENEADRLMREGIRAIFVSPKDPYHDFKIKELYERLEQTTDCCEDVANILDSIVLRYA